MNKFKELVNSVIKSIVKFPIEAFTNAIFHRRKESVEKFMKIPWLLNQVNSSNETPLYYACLKTDVELVKRLLDKGANPNLGKSPLEVLLVRLNVVNEQNSPDLPTGMRGYWEHTHEEAKGIFKLLLDNGATVGPELRDQILSLNSPVVVNFLIEKEKEIIEKSIIPSTATKRKLVKL